MDTLARESSASIVHMGLLQNLRICSFPNSTQFVRSKQEVKKAEETDIVSDVSSLLNSSAQMLVYGKSIFDPFHYKNIHME